MINAILYEAPGTLENIAKFQSWGRAEGKAQQGRGGARW